MAASVPMSRISLAPLSGAGPRIRLRAWVRGLVSRRALLRLVGVDAVVLEGRTYAVRAVPLGVARELVPAIIRCSRRFAAWEIDETLYDDLVTVLALGLGTTRHRIEHLTIPLWDLAPVIDRIARVNSLPVLEAGTDPGKLLAALMTSTGTNSTPSSSAPPVGPGTTSIAT